MTTQAIKLMTLGLFNARKYAPVAGALAGHKDVTTLKGVGGRTLRCTSGNLHVTIEGDTKDYLLSVNQAVAIPNLGKVVVSGCGSYRAL
jgi:hypothetical protein